MIENLEERGCMIPGIVDCPDEKAQIKRMIDGGFSKAECFDMNEIHNKKLD